MRATIEMNHARLGHGTQSLPNPDQHSRQSSLHTRSNRRRLEHYNPIAPAAPPVFRELREHLSGQFACLIVVWAEVDAALQWRVDSDERNACVIEAVRHRMSYGVDRL